MQWNSVTVWALYRANIKERHCCELMKSIYLRDGTAAQRGGLAFCPLPFFLLPYALNMDVMAGYPATISWSWKWKPRAKDGKGKRQETGSSTTLRSCHLGPILPISKCFFTRQRQRSQLLACVSNGYFLSLFLAVKHNFWLIM